MLIDYWPSILALTAIQLAGVISPGPDFAIVMRNSLVYSRPAGVWTAVGIALGSMVHLAYVLLGLGLLVSKTAWLFHLLKYLGGGYLIYIGIKAMQCKKHSIDYGNSRIHKAISPWGAFRAGFLTNVLNAKCLLFFLSALSAFLAPTEPGVLIFVYGAIIFLTTLLWFLMVALCFSHERLRLFLGHFHHWVERVTGGLLFLLGIWMLCIGRE